MSKAMPWPACLISTHGLQPVCARLRHRGNSCPMTIALVKGGLAKSDRSTLCCVWNHWSGKQGPLPCSMQYTQRVEGGDQRPDARWRAIENVHASSTQC